VVTVSPAEPADAAAIAELLAELSEFYGVPAAGTPAERARQVSEALFGQPPAAHALLARNGRQVAGLAAYSFVWPAVGLTRSLYLKELFVAGACRGQGAGRLLMQAVFDTAARLGCSRVEWTTDTGNAPARSFYAGLDLPVHPGKIFYRVDGTASGVRLAGEQQAAESDSA
jgi:GNAT superfamily N-acetyltransferase